MRSRIGRTRSLGTVVTIVKVLRNFPSGFLQKSHNPRTRGSSESADRRTLWGKSHTVHTCIRLTSAFARCQTPGFPVIVFKSRNNSVYGVGGTSRKISVHRPVTESHFMRGCAGHKTIALNIYDSKRGLRTTQAFRTRHTGCSENRQRFWKTGRKRLLR